MNDAEGEFEFAVVGRADLPVSLCACLSTVVDRLGNAFGGAAAPPYPRGGAASDAIDVGVGRADLPVSLCACLPFGIRISAIRFYIPFLYPPPSCFCPVPEPNLLRLQPLARLRCPTILVSRRHYASTGVPLEWPM